MGDKAQAVPAPGHGFGTLPVYFAAISTILGAVMFLRFGYAVAHVGLAGAVGIILLGHLVTVPTALAIAEIATNRRVEGGGEYFIVSRSFGTTIGGVIGLSLYLSQAISVAFYMLAFAEAFTPLAPWFTATFDRAFDTRFVSLPAAAILLAAVWFKGAGGGVKLLYAVVAILAASLAAFFLGKPVDGFDAQGASLTGRLADGDPFFVVFAICFPAFTGMTAGVGLSGDLANPRRAIPAGTLAATATGMVVYLALVAKLAWSAPVEDLAGDQLVMSRIALWGPLIPIGLGAATLSSALGSVLVAPRTLQALGADRNVPLRAANRWLARGAGEANEPRNATVVTAALALVIIALGNVDFVARIISMFFMVTYGSLCAISFLEHFAARPSYRPGFRSRWYVSLFGALICLFMMFQMDPLYALLALALLVALYQVIRRQKGGAADDIAAMFEGVMTQATRHLNVQLQSRRRDSGRAEWRPSIIMVNDRTFERRAPLNLMRWLSHRHGFGMYLHYIHGVLDARTGAEAQGVRQRLVEMARLQNSAVYMDTIVSPSLKTALAQSLQVPGVSGLHNNCVMFEFSVHDGPEALTEVVDNCLFVADTGMTQLVLRHGDLHFGERRNVHVWLTWNDAENANVMILLGYILAGHADWKDAAIRVYLAYPRESVRERRAEIKSLIAEGRMPVSEMNIRYMPVDDVESFREAVARYSAKADLTIVGYDLQGLRERREDLFRKHPDLGDVLFVHSPRAINIR